MKEKQIVGTAVKEKESVCDTENGERDRKGGGVMIALSWQKRDWPHGRQGDTDRPMKKVFTQHSMCQCIR